MSRMHLPSRFTRLTGSKSKIVQALERSHRKPAATVVSQDTPNRGQRPQHELTIQGIKTIRELSAKNVKFKTLGITFQDQTPIQDASLALVRGIESSEFKADEYYASSRNVTARILGTASKTGPHEVWARVLFRQWSLDEALNKCIRDHKQSGKPSTEASEKILVFDQISDPGNMGLLIRAAKAMGWQGSWRTPNSVAPLNEKVVRASRALCLEWPTTTGSWKELEVFLKRRDMTLIVADMLPQNLGSMLGAGAESIRTGHELVWWNWPKQILHETLPPRIALVLSSEHHGTTCKGEEMEAKERLLKSAIRVSIPMCGGVESMNVATAGTAMMWELNRLSYSRGIDRQLRIIELRAAK